MSPSSAGDTTYREALLGALRCGAADFPRRLGEMPIGTTVNVLAHEHQFTDGFSARNINDHITHLDLTHNGWKSGGLIALFECVVEERHRYFRRYAPDANSAQAYRLNEATVVRPTKLLRVWEQPVEVWGEKDLALFADMPLPKPGSTLVEVRDEQGRCLIHPEAEEVASRWDWHAGKGAPPLKLPYEGYAVPLAVAVA